MVYFSFLRECFNEHVCFQAHLSWCWQQVPVYLWPLSKPMATATRHLQDTLSQHLSRASAMACRDPLTPSGWSYHPSISFLPQTSLSLSIALSLCPLQGSRWYCRPIYFFIPLFFLKLSWRTHSYFFLLSTLPPKISSSLIFSHSILFTINLSIFAWVGSGSCTMEGLWKELAPFPV